MVTEETIREQLPHVLRETHLTGLGECYRGKVRDNYTSKGKRIIVTTDRLSCFDVVVAAIPYKGEVLNRLTTYWFNVSGEIVSNHIIDVPDPNVLVVQDCQVLPVEVVVRRYLAGSAWRAYKAGEAVSGVALPPGLNEYEKLPELLLTPSTKAALGAHDEPISEEAIVSGGLVEKSLWDEIRDKAFNLFRLGERIAAERGLMLVDTKYEFGLKGNQLVLVDEIHTLDSSRYWVAGTYGELVKSGQSPEMLDKEPARQWLLNQGYSGNGTPPVFDDAKRTELSLHYINSFERITGQRFSPTVGNPHERIERRCSAVGRDVKKRKK